MRAIVWAWPLLLGCSPTMPAAPKVPIWATTTVGKTPDIALVVDVAAIRREAARDDAPESIRDHWNLLDRVAQFDAFVEVGNSGESTGVLAVHGTSLSEALGLPTLAQAAGSQFQQQLETDNLTHHARYVHSPRLLVTATQIVVAWSTDHDARVTEVSSLGERTRLPRGHVFDLVLRSNALGAAHRRMRDTDEFERIMMNELEEVHAFVTLEPKRRAEVYVRYGAEQAARNAELAWSWRLHDGRWRDIGELLATRSHLDRDGSVVHLSINLEPPWPHVKSEAPQIRGATPEASPTYPSHCKRGQRYDLDSHRCIDIQ